MCYDQISGPRQIPGATIKYQVGDEGDRGDGSEEMNSRKCSHTRQLYAIYKMHNSGAAYLTHSSLCDKSTKVGIRIA